jgi:hypothetical protein
LFQHGEGPGGGIVSAIVYLDGRHGGQRRRSLLPGGKSRGGAQEGAAAVVVDRGDEVGDGVEDAARRGRSSRTLPWRTHCFRVRRSYLMLSSILRALTYLGSSKSPVLSIASLSFVWRPLFTANSAFTFPRSNITSKSDQECPTKEFVSGCPRHKTWP